MADLGAGGPDVSGDANPLDRTFDVLAAAERQYMIRLLLTGREPIAIADLALEIAKAGEGPLGADDPHDSAQRIREFLYHVHIPKLAEEGVVEFDAERNTVSRGAAFEPYAAVLRLVDDL